MIVAIRSGISRLLYVMSYSNRTTNTLKTTNGCSWDVKSSIHSQKTVNKIRLVTEGIKLLPNTEKEMIPLSVGDPTIFGNFQTSDVVTEAVKECLESKKCNGYGPTIGVLEARRAIAKYSVHQGQVTEEDVILCNGCSSALEICMVTLASPGDNIFCAKPGFSNYETLTAGLGIEMKRFNLIPKNNWEIDLVHLESSIDDRTKAILITNPSNPCGSVFSKEHLLEVIDIAERHRLPIIADEVRRVFFACCLVWY